MWSRLNGLSTRIINYTWMFARGQMDIYVYIRKCANTGSQINSFSPIIRNELKSKCKCIVQIFVHLFGYAVLIIFLIYACKELFIGINMLHQSLNINTFGHLVICKAWFLFWYTHVFLNFLFLLIDYLIENLVDRTREEMKEWRYPHCVCLWIWPIIWPWTSS